MPIHLVDDHLVYLVAGLVPLGRKQLLQNVPHPLSPFPKVDKKESLGQSGNSEPQDIAQYEEDGLVGGCQYVGEESLLGGGEEQIRNRCSAITIAVIGTNMLCCSKNNWTTASQ